MSRIHNILDDKDSLLLERWYQSDFSVKDELYGLIDEVRVHDGEDGIDLIIDVFSDHTPPHFHVFYKGTHQFIGRPIITTNPPTKEPASYWDK